MAKPKTTVIHFQGYDYVKINGVWTEETSGTTVETQYGKYAAPSIIRELDTELARKSPQPEPTQPKQQISPASKPKKPEIDLSDLMETTDTTYTDLLKKVEAGDVTEDGRKSNRLQVAKLLKDGGVPIDENMIKYIDKQVRYAVRSGDLKGTLRKFIKNTIDQYNRSEELSNFDKAFEEGMKKITEENRKKPSGYTDTPHMKSPQGKPPPAEPEDTRTHWEKLADQYQHEAEEISRDIQDVIGNVTSLFTGKRPASASSMAQSVADSPFRRMYKQKLRSIHPLLPLISGRLQGMSKSVSPTKTSASHIHPKSHIPGFGEIAQVLGVHAATNEDHIPEYVSDKAYPQGTADSSSSGNDDNLLSALRAIEVNTRASLSLLAKMISPTSSIAKQSFPGISGGVPTSTENSPQDITNSKNRFFGLERILPGYFQTQSGKIDSEEAAETSRLKSEELQSGGEKPIKVEISNPDDVGKSISEDMQELDRKLSDLTDAEKERLSNLGYKQQGIGYRKPSGKMASKKDIFKMLKSPRKMSELNDAEKETLAGKGFKPQGIGYSHPEGGMATKEQIFDALKPDSLAGEHTEEASGLGDAALGSAERFGIARFGGPVGPYIAAAMLASKLVQGGTNAYFGYGSDLAKKSKYAKGGIVNNMSVNAFADGGIVDKPTLFNHSSGQGLMGEAGSEAIMPLKRGSDGKLGVAAGEMNKPSVMGESIALKKATDMKNDISGSSNGQQPVIINDNKTINNGNGGGGQSMAILGSSTAGPRNSLDLNYFAR